MDGFSAGVADETSLALESLDIPYVAYEDDVTFFASDALGIEPDKVQAEFLNSQDPDVLFLAERQCGKSEFGSIKAVYTALFKP